MRTVAPHRPRSRSIHHRARAWATVVVIAGTLLAVTAAPAHAAPPPALPAASDAEQARWQPAFDYDTDGCYPTPAVGPDGTLNPGLNPSGALDGGCRDRSDLDNTNSYVRSRCDDSGWCAHLYDLYFEKDQVIPGWDPFGHRHDIEHVVVWVRDGIAQYVATSAHGDYTVHPRTAVTWQGTHPRIVYHKDGPSTHCFRLASATETPENHHGTWRFPDLVGWNHFPTGVRDILTAADFGSASLGISDAAFGHNLAEAMPPGIDFDPYG
ncbi:necrosis inducing protein (NPP1) [Stackebrandtia albiflava]|uniref:Necrosis inducing protein (NPP1) n=1 Tax=Stackebrandtia albiflava TaxID=406432 RepID=A0A562VAV8_9ACTN|nr:NPP1 family protein [Stackebrandtia albiflava]TWJ14988.1 necrosis inducing protein (NPP1) [Stackebrandtia albiflava]